MTPAGLVAARLLEAFAPTSREQAATLLAMGTRVPTLTVVDIREILAGYHQPDDDVDDDDLRDTHVAVPGGHLHDTFPVGDPGRGQR